MRTVALDWETYYDKECTVKLLGNWAYCRHPNFEAYMVSVYDGADWKWAGHPSQMDWDRLSGCRVLSHNANFDANVYAAEAAKGNVPWIDIPEWHCTANLSVALCGHRDLKRATHALLGPEFLKQAIGKEGMSKATRGAAEGMHYEDFLKEPGRWKEMVDYATDDVIGCWHLWDRFHARLSPLEHLMSDMSVRSGFDGVGVNWDLVDTYQRHLDSALVMTRAQLPWVHQGEKEMSVKAIRDYCGQCGIPIPPVKDDDEEGYNTWVETHKEQYPWVEMISEYRKYAKMSAFLRQLNARRRPDGTIESPLLYFGGHTGRWSGKMGSEKGSTGINLQALRKKPLDVAGMGIHQRHVFVPRNPKTSKFIIADYTQIEARVTNWLVGNQKFVDMLATTDMSVYEAHARATMGWEGGELKKENNDLYQLAKARVLMLGYGAGAKKFSDTAYKLIGRHVPMKEAKQIVQDFRKSNPQLVAYWRARDEELRRAGSMPAPGNIYVYKLPSGRPMVYNSVQTKLVEMRVPDYEKDPDGELGIMKAALIPQTTAVVSGWQVRPFYGGKLTENFVQATARDLFAEGLRRVYEKGWHVPFHVHDEVLVEVDKSVPVEEVVACLEYQPEWAAGLPVGVDAHESDHYLKAD